MSQPKPRRSKLVPVGVVLFGVSLLLPRVMFNLSSER